MGNWILPAVLTGFLMDLCIGDPRWMYHPVCMIGNAITACEKWLRAWFPKTKRGEQMAGGMLVLCIVSGCVLIPGGLLFLAYRLHPAAGFILESCMCWQMLATKSLKTESMKVYERLQAEDVEGARKAVSMIVGRDTAALTEEGITKAAVETVAENTSDGVIAPLLYMMLAGGVGAYFYKAINTMDSMVGYKNEKYKNFGTCAAKLDDLVNYIPARLSAWFMVAAAAVEGHHWKDAIRIYRRDRRNHASPNSAQTEAVMAGALGVQLAGNAWYFGKLYEKPTIGDDKRKIEAEDIRRANQMLYGTAVIAVLAFTMLYIGICL